jgi:hypothetical protein
VDAAVVANAVIVQAGAEVTATATLVIVPQPSGDIQVQARVIRPAHRYHESCLRLRFACLLRFLWERRLDNIDHLYSPAFLRRTRYYNSDFKRSQELQYTSNEDKIFKLVFEDNPIIARPISYSWT